jgi:ketosteroid isomerase-like protein
VNALLALYVDDPVVMPPGRPAIEGLRALRDHEQAHHDAFAHPALEYESQELVVAGDWAFDRGIERLTEAPKDGSASIDVVGKYLTVYQRQPGGGWKIARGIFNSSEDGVGGGSPFLLAQPCM